MKISAFKITNFRSILDTGWCKLSPDGVTVLVGQNESGKSSVLEAIASTFSNRTISEDDVRVDAPLPKVMLKICTSYDELETYLPNAHPHQLNAFRQFLETSKGQLTVEYSWEKSDKKPGEYDCSCSVVEEKLEEALSESEASAPVGKQSSATENGDAADADEEKIVELTMDDIWDAINEVSPYITLFDRDTLPAQIDIDDTKYQLVGAGAAAANNFLTVAGLNLKELVTEAERVRETKLARANARISQDFLAFWSQKIGKNTPIALECDVKTYGNDTPEKAGKRYLVFRVSDGHDKLYLKQRSAGFQWYLSFYLQLRASEKKKSNRIFLLDEPGANLHAKAQGDVLRLINELSTEIPIIYSTHSPHMLEYDNLYRVLAVQRSGALDDSPTEIKSALELGSASTDTLSPILTAMGTNLSSQEVIKHRNNVLLEEISGFYYMRAFWELTKSTAEAHFIAATGVNNVERLANMFLGWGLDFIVVVDDETKGRSVYNDLKRNIYGDDADSARDRMYKIKDCKGIEDIFSADDFAKLVIGDASVTISTTNSEFAKSYSKPVLAYQFLQQVRNGKITMKNLGKVSSANITTLVGEISSRLEPAKKSRSKAA